MQNVPVDRDGIEEFSQQIVPFHLFGFVFMSMHATRGSLLMKGIVLIYNIWSTEILTSLQKVRLQEALSDTMFAFCTP